MFFISPSNFMTFIASLPCNFFGKMHGTMTFIISQLKIFYSIICFNMINMMNYLISFKISTNMLFHNQPMLSNIPIKISRWMVISFNHYISTVNSFSTIPSRRFLFNHVLRNPFTHTYLVTKFSLFVSFFMKHIVSALKTISMVITTLPICAIRTSHFFTHKNICTFSRAISTSYMRSISRIRIFAGNTFNFYHRLILSHGGQYVPI